MKCQDAGWISGLPYACARNCDRARRVRSSNRSYCRRTSPSRTQGANVPCHKGRALIGLEAIEKRVRRGRSRSTESLVCQYICGGPPDNRVSSIEQRLCVRAIPERDPCDTGCGPGDDHSVIGSIVRVVDDADGQLIVRAERIDVPPLLISCRIGVLQGNGSV